MFSLKSNQMVKGSVCLVCGRLAEFVLAQLSGDILIPVIFDVSSARAGHFHSYSESRHSLAPQYLTQRARISRHHFLRVERRLRLGPAREITIDLESVLVGAHLPDLQAKAPPTTPSPHIRAPHDPC